MKAYRCLEAACRSIDLGLRCECAPTEPRFQAALDHAAESTILALRLRNDDTISPAAVHHDPAVPGLLFEIVEETVRREPSLSLWLPCTERHQFLAWRNGGDWMLEQVPGGARVATVNEALVLFADRAPDDSV